MNLQDAARIAYPLRDPVIADVEMHYASLDQAEAYEREIEYRVDDLIGDAIKTMMFLNEHEELISELLLAYCQYKHCKLAVSRLEALKEVDNAIELAARKVAEREYAAEMRQRADDYADARWERSAWRMA